MSDEIKIKKESVRIQLLTRDTSGELVAILQVRAKWNAEKNTPEIWPGACQVTAHGKLEKGEDFIQGLMREVREELGNQIAPIIQNYYATQQLKELINFETPDKHVITYGIIIDENIWNILKNKEKNNSFGGFKLIHHDEINKIVDLKTIDKNTGVTDDTIAMFPDEKEAVHLAFEKLS